MDCPPKKKLLLDSRKSLTDCSHPQGWIVCRAIELNLAESLRLPKSATMGTPGRLSRAEAPDARSPPLQPMHPREQDFVQPANRGQKPLDPQLSGESPHG